MPGGGVALLRCLMPKNEDQRKGTNIIKYTPTYVDSHKPWPIRQRHCEQAGEEYQ